MNRAQHLYRKSLDGDLWHCSRACPAWPTVNYLEQAGKPESGSLCRQCAELQEAARPNRR